MEIFISYRRGDSVDVAGRIRDRLAQDFDPRAAYMDIDSIPIGVDFRDHIDAAVRQCDVLLVIVGPDWATTTDAHGARRLDDPSDFVRLEVEAALRRSVPVVPLLVRGATIPQPAELPPSMRSFAYRQAVVVRSDPDFHPDMARLVAGLQDHGERLAPATPDAVGTVPVPPAAAPPPSPERAVESQPAGRSRRWWFVAVPVVAALLLGAAVLGFALTRSDSGDPVVASATTVATTLAPTSAPVPSSASTLPPATSAATSPPTTTAPPTTLSPESHTTKSIVPVPLASAQTSYPALKCDDTWITVLASRGVEPGVNPDDVAKALLREAQAAFSEANVFEYTASCPALAIGMKLRLASFVGPYRTADEALQPCRASTLFQQRGCYAARLRPDETPEEFVVGADGGKQPRNLGYLARAANWPVYEQPDANSASTGTTDFLYQVLTVTCQRTGPVFQIAGESSNIWTRVEQPVAGWISDLAVIGTPVDGLDPRLPPCP